MFQATFAFLKNVYIEIQQNWAVKKWWRVKCLYCEMEIGDKSFSIEYEICPKRKET